jgi:hypothetical protein
MAIPMFGRNGGTKRSHKARGVLVCSVLSLLLAACGGRGIVRDDAAVVPQATMSSANLDYQEMLRFVEITRKVSIQSAELCEHKMPLLDFVAHAMPTEGMKEPDVQAMIRVAKLGAETRVLVSGNADISSRAIVEKVGSKTIKPSIPGWEFQRAVTYEAVGKESIDLQIGGKTYTYNSKLVCAAVPLYRLEAEPKPYNMSFPSERFIVSLARNPKPEMGLRSDNEIAFLVALQVAGAAGGKLDAAMTARNVMMLSSFIPIGVLLARYVAGPVMNSLVDQDEIDTLAFQMLEKSGFDAGKGVSDYLARCGPLCSKSWPLARKERWLTGMRQAKVPSAVVSSGGDS